MDLSIFDIFSLERECGSDFAVVSWEIFLIPVLLSRSLVGRYLRGGLAPELGVSIRLPCASPCFFLDQFCLHGNFNFCVEIERSDKEVATGFCFFLS